MRQVIKETSPQRREYVERTEVCEVCNQAKATDCHEIAAGSHRLNALYQTNVWLATCRQCHEEIQGIDFATQAAIKARAVVNTINRVLGRCAIEVKAIEIQNVGSTKQ